MPARLLAPLVAAALLAGCTLGEPPTQAEPRAYASPCGALALRVEPERVPLGESVHIEATFTNCGADALPLAGSGRCGRGHPLAATVHHDRTYALDDARPATALAEGDFAHHGSCGPVWLGEPLEVPAGGNVTASWTWDGSRALLLTWRSPFAAGDGLAGTSITATVSPEPRLPGAHRLTVRVATAAGDAAWERSLDVHLEGDAPPGPEPRSAFTRWRPQPDMARPQASGLPDDPRLAAAYAANGSLASRLGPSFFERNARLVGVAPDGRNATCDPPACDRWLATYDLRLGESGATFRVAVPVAGGVVVDAVPIEGVPDCREDRSECEFPLSQETALDVARQHGASEATHAEMAWHAVLAEEGTLGTYAWRVAPSGMLLDANDGTRLDAPAP